MLSQNETQGTTGSEMREVHQHGGFELRVKAGSELEPRGGGRGAYIMRTARRLGRGLKKGIMRLPAARPWDESERTNSNPPSCTW